RNVQVGQIFLRQ
ncbi:hypothetical protein D049_5192B, partial [Vibrio parahaemolyticus VPTS-2010]